MFTCVKDDKWGTNIWIINFKLWEHIEWEGVSTETAFEGILSYLNNIKSNLNLINTRYMTTQKLDLIKA